MDRPTGCVTVAAAVTSLRNKSLDLAVAAVTGQAGGENRSSSGHGPATVMAAPAADETLPNLLFTGRKAAEGVLNVAVQCEMASSRLALSYVHWRCSVHWALISAFMGV